MLSSGSADSAMDSAVSLRFYLDNIPLEGPGANIRAAIGANGEVTQLSYAVRALAEVGHTKVVNEEEARKRCATWTTLSDKRVAGTSAVKGQALDRDSRIPGQTLRVSIVA